MRISCASAPGPQTAELARVAEECGYSLTGTASEVHDRVEAFQNKGITEFVYQPVGPDPISELRQMAEALRLPRVA